MIPCREGLPYSRQQCGNLATAPGWWAYSSSTLLLDIKTYQHDHTGEIRDDLKVLIRNTDNIEDYNDSEELRRDLMFDNTQLSLGGGASKDDCVNPWECNRPCPIGYFR